ncbi:HAD family hydrolase [Brackiella oedipodis]|uniref:HAD family hydrolase n=1 Tax=Brackiella oedipodis TaxID=124225 RepID=UPI00048F6170|nr:HAD family hydrolase [Brackiella oedipodis]
MTTSQALALFDLDHTLLPLDSDHEWVVWLAKNNYVGNLPEVEKRNQELTELYHAGQLKIEDSMAFMLSFLKNLDPFELARIHEIYMQEVIRPHIHQVAIDLVDQHLQNGDLCCLVSATNSFVIAPIARAFGFEHVIGTTPEYLNGRYTGKFVGTASYQAGKITRVEEWLKALGHGPLSSFDTSYFYSDSINDLPLLKQVSHPVAVNPQDELRTIAQQNHWDILDLFQKV